MHRSGKFQTPPNAVDFLYLVKALKGVKGSFLCVCFLRQIVTGQYNPNILN